MATTGPDKLSVSTSLRGLVAAGIGLLALAAPAVAAGLPSLALSGPYGDPLALPPSPFAAFEAALDPGQLGLPAGSGTAPAPSAAVSAPVADRGGAPHDDERVQPGAFGHQPNRLPGLGSAKGRVLAPHLTPDVEIAAGRQTSVGMFGGVGRVEIERGAGLVPTVRPREVGAGLSLQYRFGE